MEPGFLPAEKHFPAIYSKYKKLAVQFDMGSVKKREDLWKDKVCNYALDLQPKKDLTQSRQKAALILDFPKSARTLDSRQSLMASNS